jgi:DNA-binding GntR family transcriptional regulator
MGNAMAANAPLRIESVVDQVYAAVRARILSGELPGGSRLLQTSLADELGVSRTPLREALRRLSTEGLVVLEANRGATVAGRDLDDMWQAWRARLTFEPAAARLAAEVREPEALERMETAIARQRQVAADVAASFAVNRDFHVALVAAAANPHLSQFAEMLWLTRIGAPIFFGQAAEHPEDAQRWADDHEGILAAVRAGKRAAAERLTREHIAASPPEDAD